LTVREEFTSFMHGDQALLIEPGALDFLLLRDWTAVAKGIARTVRALAVEDPPMIVGYAGRDETFAKLSDVVKFHLFGRRCTLERMRHP
jgi:hypothetical protein